MADNEHLFFDHIRELMSSFKEKDIFVHVSSYVDKDVQIGKGTKIWHFSHILSGSKIGSNCIIGQNVMIGPNVSIGRGCKIQNNVSIYNGVTIENDVFVGPSVVFTNVINPRAFVERKDQFRPTLIEKGVSLGANSTILCGITIGEYAMIGAGATITKDVERHSIVIGIDKVVGRVCKCGDVRLKGDWIPSFCRCMK